jgi:hypothetical protein
MSASSRRETSPVLTPACERQRRIEGHANSSSIGAQNDATEHRPLALAEPAQNGMDVLATRCSAGLRPARRSLSFLIAACAAASSSADRVGRTLRGRMRRAAPAWWEPDQRLGTDHVRIAFTLRRSDARIPVAQAAQRSSVAHPGRLAAAAWVR